MTKDNLTRVDKVAVRIAGRQSILLPDEARKLRDALIELLGPKVGSMPFYTQQPIWIDLNSEDLPGNWSICYGNDITLIINA